MRVNGNSVDSKGEKGDQLRAGFDSGHSIKHHGSWEARSDVFFDVKFNDIRQMCKKNVRLHREEHQLTLCGTLRNYGKFEQH